MEIRTDTDMPPMGVADVLMIPEEVPDSVERYRFWLLSHTSSFGPRFWRNVVVRLATPGINSELTFEAISPLISR